MVGSIDSSPFGKLASFTINDNKKSEASEQPDSSKSSQRQDFAPNLRPAVENNQAASVNISGLRPEEDSEENSPIQESREGARPERPQTERPERGDSGLRGADESRAGERSEGANKLGPPPKTESSGPPGAAAGLGAAPRADEAPDIQAIAQQNRAAAESTSSEPVTEENNPLDELQAQGSSVRELGPEEDRPEIGSINIQA